MSYLESPRLHFAGRFQAAVSTVNNDPANYLGPVQDGGWNPEGSGSWRVKDCRITGLRSGHRGAPAGPDPLADGRVLDAGDRVSAKIVDLDPEQQLVSQIWGLRVQVVDGDGRLMVAGSFTPVGFTDLWRRSRSGGGMAALGACWTSILEELEWHHVHDSPFLRQLQDRSPDRLSVKFNVDGFQPDATHANFTHGRLVGTIGPSAAGEPRHFVAGRLLRSRGAFAPALVDTEHGRLTVDLGNSLPTTAPGGAPAPAASGYHLAVNRGAAWEPLSALDANTAGFYESTAGVVEADLTVDQLAAAADGRLGLVDGDRVVLEESPSRLYLRADQFVFRLGPGDEATVQLVVTEAGRPPGRPLAVDLTAGGGIGEREPAGGVAFPASVETGAEGRASFTITAGDPGGVRAAQGLEGQVYGIGYSLADEPAPVNPDPWDFLSLLVFDVHPPVARPTWFADIEPLFAKYHRLYPVMGRILDLSDYESVLEHLEVVALSFDLPASDPNHMPVVRDMSPATHEMLRRWFGAPLRGHRRPSAAPRTMADDQRRPVAGPVGPEGTLADLTETKRGRREPDA
jgi:hypothetical protein